MGERKRRVKQEEGAGGAAERGFPLPKRQPVTDGKQLVSWSLFNRLQRRERERERKRVCLGEKRRRAKRDKESQEGGGVFD